MTAAMYALVLAVTALHTVAGHSHAAMPGMTACQDSLSSEAATTQASAYHAIAENADHWAAPVDCPSDGPSCMAVLTKSSVSVALQLNAIAALPAMMGGCLTTRLLDRSPPPAAVGLSVMQGSVLRI